MSFLFNWHNTAKRLLAEELERRIKERLIEAHWYMNESPLRGIVLAVTYTTSHKHNSIKNAYVSLATASNVSGINKLPLEYFDEEVKKKRKIKAEIGNERLRKKSIFSI